MQLPPTVSRRRFFRTVGAASAAGLSGTAGCVGRSDTVTMSFELQPAGGQPGSPAGSSAEYRRLDGGIKWRSLPVRFDVGTATFPATLDTAAVERCVRRAFETWNAVPGTKRVFDQPRFDDGLSRETNGNGVNELVWRSLSSDSVGTVWATGNQATSRLAEIDIVLNTDRPWATDPTAADQRGYDVQAMVTHELGHNGLRDVVDAAASEQTMFHQAHVGETKKRSLEAGDVAGWQAVYGAD